MQKTNHLAENNKLQNKKLHKIRLKINLAKLILECYGIFRVGMGFKNIYYITYENIINNYLLTWPSPFSSDLLKKNKEW